MLRSLWGNLLWRSQGPSTNPQRVRLRVCASPSARTLWACLRFNTYPPTHLCTHLRFDHVLWLPGFAGVKGFRCWGGGSTVGGGCRLPARWGWGAQEGIIGLVGRDLHTCTRFKGVCCLSRVMAVQWLRPVVWHWTGRHKAAAPAAVILTHTQLAWNGTHMELIRKCHSPPAFVGANY